MVPKWGRLRGLAAQSAVEPVSSASGKSGLDHGPPPGVADVPTQQRPGPGEEVFQRRGPGRGMRRPVIVPGIVPGLAGRQPGRAPRG